MWARSKIRRYLNVATTKRIFFSADVLGCGSRSEVDKALYCMVQSGEIERIADGIFGRPGEGQKLTPLDVASLKAQALDCKLLIPFDWQQNAIETEETASFASNESMRRKCNWAIPKREKLPENFGTLAQNNVMHKQSTEL